MYYNFTHKQSVYTMENYAMTTMVISFSLILNEDLQIIWIAYDLEYVLFLKPNKSEK